MTRAEISAETPGDRWFCLVVPLMPAQWSLRDRIVRWASKDESGSPDHAGHNTERM
jgi:hypothetical protein